LEIKAVEIRQLTHFIAVAEERSFTRAARRVHIVQSGISTSISALERELGAPLFHRSRRHVELTPAGRALLGEARRVVAAVSAARTAIGTAGKELSGTLNIGLVATIPPELRLAELLRVMTRDHPAVSVRVTEVNAPTHEQVKNGEFDIAIGPGHAPAALTTIPLASYPLVLACPDHHRFAHRTSIALGALRDEPFVELPVGWTVRSIVDRAFADAAIDRRVVLEVNQIRMLLQAVAAGIGVGFVPSLYARMWPSARFIQIRPSIGTWELAISYLGPEPASPAARAFLTLLLTDFRARAVS
jgi:DNA-binding transcriptional LysR family regulator